MNLSYFISKRIRNAESNSFSSIIHKIAIASIAIGLAAAIVSFLIMQGFQSAVKNRIYGFSNHLLITKFTMNNAVEEQPFDFQIDLYNNPDQFPFVKHVQEFSHKAGLIKAEEEVLGIVFKGVGAGFNLEGFKENLLEGQFLQFPDSSYSNQVVISRIIADKINAKTGDELIVHFFQNPPRFRRLQVSGIYETNLSDYFDSKVIIGDLRLVQRLNDWSDHQAGGLEVQLDLDSYSYVQLLRVDFDQHLASIQEQILDNPEVENRYWVATTTLLGYTFDYDKAALEESARQIGESMDYDLYLETVRDKYIQVFEWLDLIKRQVKILLVVILVVVCVNMISVILILVMERTPMVGILKAMGAQDQFIRSVFLYNGMSLIAKGLLFGNGVGLGLCFIQDRFKLITLNAHDYYMNYVPIQWDWGTVVFLNGLVFITVLVVLLLPTRFITRINPIHAIRFD
ncbi:MAG: ABC transporter permease [Cyclobacteriaceae bacterium]|nr:ABC transporter permease [Cyclobacteriaceae bacterium]